LNDVNVTDAPTTTEVSVVEVVMLHRVSPTNWLISCRDSSVLWRKCQSMCVSRCFDMSVSVCQSDECMCRELLDVANGCLIGKD